MNFIRIVCFLLIAPSCFGQTELKFMFYNLLNYPTAPPANRDALLAEVFESYTPDVFMVCELESPSGSDQVLNNSLNVSTDVFNAAPFVYNTSGGDDIQQMLYYNSDRFSLLSSEVIETPVRDINRYELLLNTVDQATNPVVFNVYVAHLKSSMGSANEALRFEMVDRFTDHLETIDPDSYVIFAGDLNFYSGAELGYLQLIATSNPIVLKDPINRNGDWHNNTDYEDLFSQSTRTSSGPFGGYGAGGGMDDRFDHILVSNNFIEDTDVNYVPESYVTLGNNGNCYNKRLIDPDCSGAYSFELRNLLYNISDHLPIGISIEADFEFLNGTDFDTTSWVNFPQGNLINEQLVIKLDPSLVGQTTMYLYNSLGQIINNIPINQELLSIDTSSYSSGLYYLAFKNKEVSPLKFIKR